MPRISSEIAALRAQYDLNRVNRQMQQAMQRLTTGLRVNRTSDDPGAKVSSELLANEANALAPAIEQTQRAGNLMATADGALAEISDLLLSIRSLVVEAANSGGMSQAEIAANQLQVDAAVASIRRLSETTKFAGRRLLDGSLDFAVSGVQPNHITDLAIGRATMTSRGYLPVHVEVLSEAAPAGLQFATSQVAGPVHVRIAGRAGSETLSFAAGTRASAIVLAINQVADDTGVSASLINPGHPASGLNLISRDVGTQSFVSVEPLDGTFTTTRSVDGAASQREQGVDTEAVINGMTVNASGRQLSLYSTDLELTLTLDASFGASMTSFVITGGGAAFPVGPSLADDLASISLPSMDPADLGNSLAGSLSDLATGGGKSLVAGRASEALRIVEAVSEQVSSHRGRLGSFARHTLEQQADSMTQMLENVTASVSAIRDADFAAETTQLTRAQLLVQVATSVMAMANASRDSVLRLLS